MKRSRIISVFIVLVAVSGFLSSCESNRWFQSEDKLRAKIQTTWSMIRIPSNAPIEEWMFKEGKVYRMYGTPFDTITGNYSVSTTLTKAFLTITDLSPDNEQFNAEWEIIELDKGLLFIATDHGGATGLRKKEFIEK